MKVLITEINSRYFTRPSLLSVAAWTALSCGPVATFSSDLPPDEQSTVAAASDSATAEVQQPIQAEPAQQVTGAYLTGVCGKSDIAFEKDGYRTVGCRSDDVNLADHNVVGSTISADEQAFRAERLPKERAGELWQVYFIIASNRLSDRIFVLEDADAAEDKKEIYRGDLVNLLDTTISISFDQFAAEGKYALNTNVYKLEPGTAKLPADFSVLKPIGTYSVPNLAFPAQSFRKGFPGLPDLLEWFAFDISMKIDIKEACECTFKLYSDDGSKLFIDGKLVINHDGVHQPLPKWGTIKLSKGLHDVRVQYFQGPKWEVALELYWKFGGMEKSVIIPPEAFVKN